MKLAELDPGRCAHVSAISATSDVLLRLQEMGLVPGVEVEMKARAPLGGPLRVRVCDYVLSLRRAQALLIDVEPA